MLQALLPLLPRGLSDAAIAFAIVIALCGAGLWLAGAGFSRYIVTLAAVAMGTIIGLDLPRWCGWDVDSMGTAVGGAVVLGASGYVLHRIWVGFWSGLILSIWASLGTWIVLARDQAWEWPVKAGTTFPVYFRSVWDALPADVGHALPMVAGAAFVIGAVPAMVWPRGVLVWLYSMVGITLAVIMGSSVVNVGHSQWLIDIPAKASLQMLALSLLVVFGAGVQWQMYFRKPARAKIEDEKNA